MHCWQWLLSQYRESLPLSRDSCLSLVREIERDRVNVESDIVRFIWTIDCTSPLTTGLWTVYFSFHRLPYCSHIIIYYLSLRSIVRSNWAYISSTWAATCLPVIVPSPSLSFASHSLFSLSQSINRIVCSFMVKVKAMSTALVFDLWNAVSLSLLVSHEIISLCIGNHESFHLQLCIHVFFLQLSLSLPLNAACPLHSLCAQVTHCVSMCTSVSNKSNLIISHKYDFI